MDPVKTAPFDLGRGPDACLLLHGFTGSPWDLRPLGESLATRGLRVVAPRLPGHGTTPEALLEVTHRDWRDAADSALASLHGHRRIFVGGLSVGALLALGLAARHPGVVAALALVAPAVRFRGPRMAVIRQLARTPLLAWAKPWADKSGSDICDPVAREAAPHLPAFPVARLRDVCALQDSVGPDATRVRCPVLVAVAEQDHVVDPEGGRWLARRLTGAPEVRFISFREGFHIIPRDTSGPRLSDEVGTFLDAWRDAGLSPWKEEAAPDAPPP
ncbi:alpha/beta fold hydrolase [Myxococcaceae bacterium JPH2]|nr:alpha/beta fold hydrolase [Myxococcaceae bacterium JPH2]